MKPLIVRYSGSAEVARQEAAGRVEVFKQITIDGIAGLKHLIETDQLDEVILAGPAVCYGWRIRVNREVQFVERPPGMSQFFADCQRSASNRIQGVNHALW